MLFSTPDFSTRKLNELKSLPTGLDVSHSPNPCHPRHGGPSGMRYTWLHSTTVTALNEDVRIVEFGGFSQFSDDPRWYFSSIYNRPFNATEFAEWYDCPGALLRPGAHFTDPSNYTGADELFAFLSHWYFIGESASGQCVKGEAIVEHVISLVS